MALRGDEKYVALNRRARHDYKIEESIEAGMMLAGTEVKVLRGGLASIAEAYASERDGTIFLVNAHFPEYPPARVNHEPRRGIFRKMRVDQKDRAVAFGRISLGDAGEAAAQHFHFGPGQHHAGFDRFLDFVVVTRAPVERDVFLVAAQRHDRPFSSTGRQSASRF